MILLFALWPLLLVPLVFAFIIDLFPVQSVYANRRLMLVWSISLLLSIVSFYHYSSSTLASRKSPPLAIFGLILFAIMALIALYFIEQEEFGFTEVFLYLSYLTCAGMTGNWMADASRSTPCPEHIAFALTACTVAYGLMTLPVYGFALFDDFSKLEAVIPWGFVNIRYWSHLATWCLPLVPLAVLAGPLAKQRLWRFGVALGAAIWWWLLFLTSSRGSMVGLLICVIVVTTIFGRQAIPWLRISSWYLALGALTWLILSVAIPSLVFDELHIRQLKVDSSGRMPLWGEAWAMSLQNFPWGMGPQSWLTHEIITPAYQNSSKFGHPHNMYLMWAAEYGWLAVGGLLLIGVGAIQKLWRRRSELRDAPMVERLPLIAFTASVVAALTHAGFSAVFIAPASMIVGLFVLAGFWGEISTSNSTKPEQIVKRRTFPLWLRLSLSGGVLALCLVWVQSVYEYHDAMNADVAYYQDVLSEGSKPRFWFHGDFPRHPARMPTAAD